MTFARPDRQPDWQDSHHGALATQYQTAREAYTAGLGNLPRWAQIALRLRNMIVAPFGLTTEGVTGAASMIDLPVVQNTKDKFEVGLFDRHLTFTILTQRSKSDVSITTSIWFNHWFGRVYLATVMLPHKIILKQILRRLA